MSQNMYERWEELFTCICYIEQSRRLGSGEDGYSTFGIVAWYQKSL